jgi:hypothetical protein
MSPIPLEQLSPSQITLLRGETFVQQWRRARLPNGIKVSSRQLGQTLVQVALLACASQGTLELQLRPQQTWFGLRTVQFLFAEPQKTSIPWSKSTLEAWLTHLAAQLRPEERHRVQTLVYVLLQQDGPNPWRRIVEEVQGGLVALGILERMEERRSRPIKRQVARVTPSLAKSIADLPTDHAQELLKTCRLAAPQLWRNLRTEVSRGISYRRKASRQVTGFWDYWIPC